MLNKSKTTSELLNKNSKKPIEHGVARKKFTALQDIETVLNDLEVKGSQEENANSSGGVRRVCNCMARRHPLFEVAPNCLNCGKIICAKEGLQPCSFCGLDIIPSEEKDAIVRLLKQEENELRNPLLRTDKQVNGASTPKAKKKIVVKMNPGEKFWEAQDRAFKLAEKELSNREKNPLEQEAESEITPVTFPERSDTPRLLSKDSKSIDDDLMLAQKKLETLLSYQSSSEERTRIIDNASDFVQPTQSIWLSPEERALMLKRQQRLAREEKKEEDRTRRGEKQMEMIIKDGKVKMVERYNPVKEDISKEELRLEEEVNMARRNRKTGEELLWDYEADKKKWVKPVYFSDRNENETTTNAARVPDSSKQRVQTTQNVDSTELIVSLL